jgi:hypothetical protein
MPNIPAEVVIQNNKLILGLPITTPTGKVRVKRKKSVFDFGTPVSTRQENLSEDCFIEWQIGYDTRDEHTEGVVAKEIIFERKGEIKYGYELTSMLMLGVQHHVFPITVIDELIAFAKSLSIGDFIEENAEILRNKKSAIVKSNLELNIVEETFPVFLFEGKDYHIDIVVKHKQRAVGYQAMIYVWLPIKNSSDQIVGRPANQKEVLHFEIDEEKNNFIFDCFKIFSLASKQHNEDIINILSAMKKISGV